MIGLASAPAVVSGSNGNASNTMELIDLRKENLPWRGMVMKPFSAVCSGPA